MARNTTGADVARIRFLEWCDLKIPRFCDNDALCDPGAVFEAILGAIDNDLLAGGEVMSRVPSYNYRNRRPRHRFVIRS